MSVAPFIKTVTNKIWNRTNTDDSLLAPPDEMYKKVDYLWDEYMLNCHYKNKDDFETYVIKNINKMDNV